MNLNLKQALSRVGMHKYSREFRLRSRIDGIRQGAKLIDDEAARTVADEYAEIARIALDQGKFEQSAQTAVLGERVLIDHYTDAQVQALAASLAARAASVLPSAHGKPVLEVLAEASSDRDKDSDAMRALVVEAHDLYERQIIHLYDTRERTSGRAITLIAILFLFTIGFAVLLLNNQTLVTELYGNEEVTNRVLIGLFLLGGLGACLSALLSFTALGRTPSAYEGWTVTLARPLVGAVAGLVAVMFVNASLVTIKNVAAMGLLAFVFGFSERLIIGAVKRLEEGQQ
jgi:hypothetical protein